MLKLFHITASIAITTFKLNEAGDANGQISSQWEFR
jgi:hypothetical protein